jgi:hypothetical protein
MDLTAAGPGRAIMDLDRAAITAAAITGEADTENSDTTCSVLISVTTLYGVTGHLWTNNRAVEAALLFF